MSIVDGTISVTAIVTEMMNIVDEMISVIATVMIDVVTAVDWMIVVAQLEAVLEVHPIAIVAEVLLPIVIGAAVHPHLVVEAIALISGGEIVVEDVVAMITLTETATETPVPVHEMIRAVVETGTTVIMVTAEVTSNVEDCFGQKKLWVQILDKNKSLIRILN
jgi:hypothetical protein